MNLRPDCRVHHTEVQWKDSYSGRISPAATTNKQHHGWLYCGGLKPDDAHDMALTESEDWDSAVALATSRMQYALESTPTEA